MVSLHLWKIYWVYGLSPSSQLNQYSLLSLISKITTQTNAFKSMSMKSQINVKLTMIPWYNHTVGCPKTRNNHSKKKVAIWQYTAFFHMTHVNQVSCIPPCIPSFLKKWLFYDCHILLVYQKLYLPIVYQMQLFFLTNTKHIPIALTYTGHIPFLEYISLT